MALMRNGRRVPTALPSKGDFPLGRAFFSSSGIILTVIMFVSVTFLRELEVCHTAPCAIRHVEMHSGIRKEEYNQLLSVLVDL